MTPFLDALTRVPPLLAQHILLAAAAILLGLDIISTPAKAGAQVQCALGDCAVPADRNLCNWTPASAGVEPSGSVRYHDEAGE